MDRSSIFKRPPRPAVAAVLALGSLALTACSSQAPPSQKGEISEGTFVYKCVGTSDAICDDGAVTPAEFPPIALGSDFAVDFTPETSTDSDGNEIFAYVDTVAPERIEVVGDPAADPTNFRAHTAGFTALVARGDVVTFDFLHVEVRPLEKLEVALASGTAGVTGALGTDTFSISAGASIKLRATLRTGTGTILGGSLPCSWSSSNPGVVDVTTSPADNLVGIKAMSAGKATMTVTISPLELQIPITVTP